jgi:hypothetical protein
MSAVVGVGMGVPCMGGPPFQGRGGRTAGSGATQGRSGQPWAWTSGAMRLQRVAVESSSTEWLRRGAACEHSQGSGAAN